MTDKLNPAPDVIDYEGVVTYRGEDVRVFSCEQIGCLIKYRNALDIFWTSIRDYHKSDRRMIREKIYRESEKVTRFINTWNEFVRTNGSAVAVIETELDLLEQ